MTLGGAARTHPTGPHAPGSIYQRQREPPGAPRLGHRLRVGPLPLPAHGRRPAPRHTQRCPGPGRCERRGAADRGTREEGCIPGLTAEGSEAAEVYELLGCRGHTNMQHTQDRPEHACDDAMAQSTLSPEAWFPGTVQAKGDACTPGGLPGCRRDPTRGAEALPVSRSAPTCPRSRAKPDVDSPSPFRDPLEDGTVVTLRTPPGGQASSEALSSVPSN